MANLYETTTDARQSEDPTLKPSRFRPRYRKLTDQELALHDEIKTKAQELEQLYEHIKPGRYLSLALTDLEQSVMWAVKELTA